jgi:hypothetical protein
MNETVKEILGILETGRPELQVAAAQILGELRAKDPAVVKGLEAAIGRSNVLGRFAIEALAKLGTQETLQVVAKCVYEHDGLADQASHLLAERMPAAQSPLAAVYDEAPLEKRGRILSVLARHLGKEALLVFERALLTPELTQQAAQLLTQANGTLAQPLSKQLCHGIARRLGDENIADVSLRHSLFVLGRLDPSGSRGVLMRFSGDRYPVEIRSAALRALAGAALPAGLVKSFLAMLEDPAQRPLHDAVRDVLSAMPEWPEGLAGTVKALLSSRQPEQKLFALRALRTSPSSETAKIALKYLHQGDAGFRAAAAEVLAVNKFAIEPLVRALQMDKDATRARTIAGILLRLAPQFPPRLIRGLADRAAKLMAGNSLAGELLFDVVAAADGKKATPLWLERAIKLRRSRRYAESLHLLARLASTPHLDVEGRYQLALTRLLHDLNRPAAESAQPGNPAMGFFAALLRDGFPLLERVRKESMLTPEALLALATHFAEAVGLERRFGAELLRHLATRTKGRAGDQARQVLRAAGL